MLVVAFLLLVAAWFVTSRVCLSAPQRSLRIINPGKEYAEFERVMALHTR